MSKASNEVSASIKSILVAVDGSANAQRAANRAIDIAKRLGAELYIVNAITIPVLATGAMAPSLETYFESMEKDGKALPARRGSRPGRPSLTTSPPPCTQLPTMRTRSTST
jgi:nucleotide-binding universal stress UspA family protein